MAEFKIDGRMTVRKLKENFKNEFEGTLRVYDGRELADDKATLAAIRKGDAKGGELVCRASRTVAKFKEEMLEVFGIKVQVASPDDWVLVLDGITLANLKNIKKNATKADMEELVAYKRKTNSKCGNTEDVENIEATTDESANCEDLNIGGLSNDDVQKSAEFKNYIHQNPDTPFVFACLKLVNTEIDFGGDYESAIETYIEDNNLIGGYGYVQISNEDEDAREIFGLGDIDECLREAVDEIANNYDAHEGWRIFYTEYVNCYHPDFTGAAYENSSAEDVILYAQEHMMNNFSNIEVPYETVRGCHAVIRRNKVDAAGGEFIIGQSEWGTSFEWDESEDETIVELSNFLAKRLQDIIDEEIED